MTVVSEHELNAHNKHYVNLPVEPLDLMKSVLTQEEYIGFLKGNMIKYAMRAGHKEGCPASEDVDKFESYKCVLNDYLKWGC